MWLPRTGGGGDGESWRRWGKLEEMGKGRGDSGQSVETLVVI